MTSWSVKSRRKDFDFGASMSVFVELGEGGKKSLMRRKEQKQGK